MSLKQGHGENVEITHVLVSRTRKTRTLIETVLLETVYILLLSITLLHK